MVNIIEETFQLGEMIAAVLLFLLILTGIFALSNPDYVKMMTTTKEVSYISSLIPDNENMEVRLKIDDEKMKIETKDNSIKTSIDNSLPYTGEYVGKEKTIVQEGNIVIIKS